MQINGEQVRAKSEWLAAQYEQEKLKNALIQTKPSPLQTQVDGGHYRNRAIQPIEYIHANGLNFSEGSIVKYITRWRQKGGVKDLEKIKHYVDLLIEMESRYAGLAATQFASSQSVGYAKEDSKNAIR